jgi:predicted aspartyl protease
MRPHPFPFLFDTGSMNVIPRDLARKLGLKTNGHSTVQAFGGTLETASALLDSLEVGDLTMGRTQALIISADPLQKVASPVCWAASF